MDEKDELIASLRQQLRKALKKCSALEQENALLFSLINEDKTIRIERDNNGIINAGTFNGPVINNMGDLKKENNEERKD